VDFRALFGRLERWQYGLLGVFRDAFLPTSSWSARVPKGFGGKPFPEDGDSKSSQGDGKGPGGGDKRSSGDGEPPFSNPVASAALVAAILGAIAWQFLPDAASLGEEKTWQEIRHDYLATGKIARFEVQQRELVRAVLKDGDKLHSQPHSVFFRIGSVQTFERQLEDAQLDLGIQPQDFIQVKYVAAPALLNGFLHLLPTLLLIGFFMFMARNAGGAGGPMNKVFNIGKVKPATKDSTSKVTFKDVAGCDEAKSEIVEFVDFLKDPAKFTRLGARIPKGALLVGPPGTGKTLLAKAVAGEANVPFFSMSGSDFIEMFVGVGPSRVRDLFAQARAAAPCIVFLDEIDAVARARGKGGFSGGNDERESTLNQLLVEMDGFTSRDNVVVLAGTNRADILDKAILRPGRFDRQIHVGLPDIKGRKEIFLVHLRPLNVLGEPEQYAARLAALTPGFAGAEISNVCNEAAIVAARENKEQIDMACFDKAVDRVIGGLEKKNSLLSKEEKRTVAYHEAGHAVAGWFLEHADPVLKVTIIPRSGGALGFAQYLPKEMALLSKEAILDKICMALGGRVSEELNFGRITTGAADDLDKVTQMAYAITTVYGMNERVGRVSFPRKEEMQFDKPYSEGTAHMIDEEVRLLVDSAYQRTKELLSQHAEAVKRVAELLLSQETISQHDIIKLIGPRPYQSDASMDEFVSASAWADIGDSKIHEEKK